MKRYLVCLLAAGSLSAQPITPDQLLVKVRSAYASLKAIHIIAERDEATYMPGRPLTTVSECELIAKGGDHYYARCKLPNEEALVISDGSNIWRALVSRKQWTKLSAASLESREEDDTSPAGPTYDMHGAVEGMLLYHFMALARTAIDPVIVKEEEYKLGRVKVHGYLVRAHTAQSAFELMVDQQTFLVVRAREQRKLAESTQETITKVKLLDVDPPVSDSDFAFVPKSGWTEVEMLTLPGERRMLLTGERAANFRLKTLTGDFVSLDDLHGKVVVLDFWATWCGPCRAELPTVEKLRAEFAGAVEFYGVNDEDGATVKKFVADKKLEMPVLLDSRSEVHKRYGVRAIPNVLIIGPDGVIREQFLGGRDASILRKAIRAALDGKA